MSLDEDIWGNADNTEAVGKVFVDKHESNPFFNYNNTNKSNDDDAIISNTPKQPDPNPNIDNDNNDENDDDSKSNLFRYFSTGLDSEMSADIRIINTEERKGKMLKYTIYIIESDVFGANLSVARRYNDFKWLYYNLGLEFIGPFIPPLPPTNVFERFKDEVVSQRRYDLERFLNRINNNKTLKTSTSFELFLCEQSAEVYEEQKKVHKKVLNERTEYDIISLLMRNFDKMDSVQIPQHLSGFDTDDLYQLDMPRVREFFMRCDERFTALNKTTKNLFQIMANISFELDALNEGLSDLYDAELQDRPTIIQNKCQQRYDIRDFMAKWKELGESQMNSFYKSFLLNLRYEHEDIKSILDGFKRYDNIHNRFKKQRQSLKKLQDKYPDKDYSENETQLAEIKTLLDFVCKIILVNDTPQIWNKKINNYNKAINRYVQSVTAKTL